MFGMIRWSRSMKAIGTSSSTKASPSQTSPVGARRRARPPRTARRSAPRRAGSARRSARRSRGSARAARATRRTGTLSRAPDWRAAAGAARARLRQRLPARQPVDDDVQEGADGEPEHAGEDRRAVIGGGCVHGADRYEPVSAVRRSATARPAATVRRPSVVDARRRPATVAASTGRRSSSARRSAQPGDLDAGAGQDRAVDRLGALLHAVEVQRVAHGVGHLVHALLERRRARRPTSSASPSTSSSGVTRPTCCIHWRACSSVRPRRSASVAAIASRPPAAARVKRQPDAVGDGDVDEAGGVDVERRRGRRLRRRQRAHHAEGGQVDALDARGRPRGRRR